MNIESIREYCLSLPLATEDFPFDDDVLAFRIGGKIFAMLSLKETEWFVLKCQPEIALELRERYSEISPAWHMNKKHWNQVNLYGHLTPDFVKSMIAHSYALVVEKLPKAFSVQNPEINTIQTEWKTRE